MSRSSLSLAVDELAPWGHSFAAAGGWKLYLVGGIVRDLLLGMEFAFDTEVDMTTDARPDVTEEVLRGWADSVWTQGKRFGTVGCRKDGRVVEITTHRADAYKETSRKPAVVFGADVCTDLSRRDFTINAMAVQLPARGGAPSEAQTGRTEPEIIDPFGGKADLERRVLETPLEPEVSFADDPLRMMRAARFVAALNVEPTRSVTAAMTKLAARLQIVSSERISAELRLLLLLEDPAPGVRLLAETGLLRQIFGGTSEPACLRSPLPLASLTPSLSLRLAALLWGVEDMDETLRRLNFSSSDVRESAASARAAASLLELANSALGRQASTSVGHSLPKSASRPAGEETEELGHAPIQDSNVRRWAAEAAPVASQSLELAAAAASCAAPAGEAQRCRSWLDSFAEHFRRLDFEENLQDPSAALTGEEVMAELGIPPGPAVGAALRYLESLRINEGPQPPTAARARLREWHALRP